MVITKEEVKKILANIKDGEKLLEYIEMLEKEIEELRNPKKESKEKYCEGDEGENECTNESEDEENMTPAQKYFKKGELCDGMGRYDDALKYYTKAIELEPDNIKYYEKRAEEYLTWAECDDEYYERAIEDYTKVIESNPKNLNDMLHNRVECYEAIGEFEKAIDDYTAIIESEYPSWTPCYIGRAQLYMYTKNYNKAIDDYTKCIEKYSDKISYIEDRAFCYTQIGDYDNAISDYKKFIEMTEDCYPDAYYNLGYVLYKKGYKDEAKANYDKACQLNPDADYKYYESEQ